MQQFKATDNKIRLSTERNRRTPVLPTIRVFADVEGSAEQADNDNTALGLIHWNSILSYSINDRVSDRELYRATLDTSATCREACYGPVLAFLYRGRRTSNVRRNLQRNSQRTGRSDQGLDERRPVGGSGERAVAECRPVAVRVSLDRRDA